MVAEYLVFRYYAITFRAVELFFGIQDAQSQHFL